MEVNDCNDVEIKIECPKRCGLCEETKGLL